MSGGICSNSTLTCLVITHFRFVAAEIPMVDDSGAGWRGVVSAIIADYTLPPLLSWRVHFI